MMDEGAPGDGQELFRRADTYSAKVSEYKHVGRRPDAEIERALASVSGLAKEQGLWSVRPWWRRCINRIGE